MDDIYREELMEIYKNPIHKGVMDDPSAQIIKENPLCGDVVSLQLKVSDGVIKDAKFDGPACAVSVISSEILVEELIGKSVEEARKFNKEDLLKLINLDLTTSRVKCAILVLDALKGALEIYERK